MTVENTTPNRGYQLPDGTNNLADDVLRLIAALSAIDVDVANQIVAIAGKAALVHGHVIDDVTGLASALAAKLDADMRGVANGVASLGGDGKVPTSQLPAAVLGAIAYQGTWNANTNTPTIPAATSANKGWYYKVATAGSTTIDGENDWKVGDWIVSNGTSWDKIDNTDQVSSVAGLVGVITAAALKTAIGLAGAAYLDVGTTAGTVAAGDDSRIVGAFQSENVIDEDDMSSDSDTKVPTQRSVKAYVDATSYFLTQSGLLTLPSTGAVDWTHGLGAVPEPGMYGAYLVWKGGATKGFSNGDLIPLQTKADDDGYGIGVFATSTKIILSKISNAYIIPPDGSAAVNLTSTMVDVRLWVRSGQ